MDRPERAPALPLQIRVCREGYQQELRARKGWARRPLGDHQGTTRGPLPFQPENSQGRHAVLVQPISNVPPVDSMAAEARLPQVA